MHKREIRSLLCSMLLGDGCIYLSDKENPKKSRAFYAMNHGSGQRDYALWKAELINEIFREKNLPKRCTFSQSKKVDKKTGKTYLGIYVKLSWTKYLRHLGPKCYRYLKGERRKNMEYLLKQVYSDLHLAIWFMDDGAEKRHKNTRGTRHIRKYINPFYELCTYGYTEGQCQLAKEWFERKYNVSPKIHYDPCRGKNGYRLRFTCPESKKLFQLLEPYFSQIPSMKQKFWLSFERYLPIKEIP